MTSRKAVGETHSQYSLLPLLSYPSFPLPLPSLTFLSQFYHQHKPLTCEIDAYGDFLQALGPDATSEVTCMPSQWVCFPLHWFCQKYGVHQSSTLARTWKVWADLGWWIQSWLEVQISRVWLSRPAARVCSCPHLKYLLCPSLTCTHCPPTPSTVRTLPMWHWPQRTWWAWGRRSTTFSRTHHSEPSSSMRSAIHLFPAAFLPSFCCPSHLDSDIVPTLAL